MSYAGRAKLILFRLLLVAGAALAAFGNGIGAKAAEGCRHPLLAARTDWPLPDCDRRLLFFVQRAMNPNTVVYWANTDGSGKIDTIDPVEVFWRRFNTTGERQDLGFFENNMLFGVTKVEGPSPAGGADVFINGHKEQVARVFLDKDGFPVSTANINGREIRLSSAFVGTVGDAKMPDIDFIDVYGIDMKTGEAVTERVYSK